VPREKGSLCPNCRAERKKKEKSRGVAFKVLVNYSPRRREKIIDLYCKIRGEGLKTSCSREREVPLPRRRPPLLKAGEKEHVNPFRVVLKGGKSGAT